MKHIFKKLQRLKSVLLSLAFLFVFSISTYAQELVSVSGVVIDTFDGPVIGATVMTSDNKGTITNLNGEFLLQDVKIGDVLSVRYIGYVTQHVTIKDSNKLTIVLQEDTETLDELVVVGYGVQKKSVVTASIAKVSSDDLAKSAPVRVDNALKGMAAGVSVTSSSGQPGAAARIRVRGVGTINNSDPLYIVDGMPIEGGLDYLNPNDIASIEVLKDAASGAVYGARAANGVILVRESRLIQK